MQLNIKDREFVSAIYISKNADDAGTPYSAVCGYNGSRKDTASLKLTRAGVLQSFRLCHYSLSHPVIQQNVPTTKVVLDQS